MRPEPLIVYDVVGDLTLLPQISLRADKVGLSLSDVFEPGLFAKKNLGLEPGWVVLVTATDGRCWASVKGETDNGRLVLEPFATPTPEPDLDGPGMAYGAPRRGPGRPPKASLEH